LQCVRSWQESIMHMHHGLSEPIAAVLLHDTFDASNQLPAEAYHALINQDGELRSSIDNMQYELTVGHAVCALRSHRIWESRAISGCGTEAS
jgi:hypothetical protein